MGQAQTVYPNGCNIVTEKDEITLNYLEVKASPDDGANALPDNVVASISLRPEFMYPFVLQLLKVGIDYQREFSVDIGFPSPKKDQPEVDSDEE